MKDLNAVKTAHRMGVGVDAGRTIMRNIGLGVLFGAVFSLTADAVAPPGRFSITDGGLTVTDSKTGLVWVRAVGPSRTATDGITYCDSLSFAGKDDWRLPTMKELQTIVDTTVMNPAVDVSFFPSTTGEFFSSSRHSGDSWSFWVVEFGQGSAFVATFGTPRQVRCVR